MNIAYLTNMLTDLQKGGGPVHVAQVADKLLLRGHTLYTNLPDESDRFVRLSEDEFFERGKEIDAFYIRLHGSAWNDGLTLLRKANPKAPCIWEINAPMEELRCCGVSEREIRKKNKRRIGLARMVDAAVCVSLEMEQYAREVLGIDKTLVVPNGSDPGMFGPDKRDPDLYGDPRFKVMWSGSPEYAWQGLDIARGLAQRLGEVDPEILMVVTAEGESSGNILYLGRIPYAEMPGYMASVDIGLCIYKEIDFFERFFFSPLKLYDYMASGLPVVGSDVGQIKMVIEENKNGLLTDTSLDDLVEKILYLNGNRAQALEMGRRGRDAVIRTYNWERVVLQIEGLISGLIEKKVPAGEDQGVGGPGLWSRTKGILRGLLKAVAPQREMKKKPE